MLNSRFKKIIFLVLFSILSAGKVEVSTEQEHLSDNTHNQTNMIYLEQKTNKFTLFAEGYKYYRYETHDNFAALGYYHDLPSNIYYMLKVGSSGSYIITPLKEYTAEIGYGGIKPYVFVYNHRTQHYRSLTADIRSGGIDYYFSFPAWLVYRSYTATNTDKGSGSAWYAKFYYQFSEKLKVYGGYTEGAEFSLIETTGAYSEYGEAMGLAGAEIKINNDLGLKINMASGKRNNSVLIDRITFSLFSNW